MTLLSPWAFAWLASLPALVWIWRLASSKHRTVIPSLVPFEHLLRRAPSRRTRLLVNALFWLQAAALALITLALVEPVLVGRRARTVLVIVDTSASMAAKGGGATPWQQAKQRLLARVSRKQPRERMLIVATAPVTPLTAEPISDRVQLTRLAERLEPADLAGSLALAARIGQGLMGGPPDETLILTDEVGSPSAPGLSVRMQSLGTPQPNAAIVGLDAYEPLCTPADPQLVVTVQNFSDREQEVRLLVRYEGRQLAEESRRLGPGDRAPIAVNIPERGAVEVSLQAEHDALEVDNAAWVNLRGPDPIQVTVASAQEAFLQAVGGWMEACPKIAWTAQRLEAAAPAGALAKTADRLLITDEAALAAEWPSSVIHFLSGAAGRRLTPAQWLIDTTHPISAYLQPLDTIASVVLPSADGGEWGDPVIWGIVQGRKVPLVRVMETRGRRVVTLMFDPAAQGRSVPLLILVLNSLRWILGSHGVIVTGEPLVVGPFAPGDVPVHRPDGSTERVPHEGGLLRYSATDRVGRYRVGQPPAAVDRVVNFLDPVESNTMARVPTWDPGVIGPPPAGGAPPRQGAGAGQDRVLVHWMLGILLAVLAAEWGLYMRRARRR